MDVTGQPARQRTAGRVWLLVIAVSVLTAASVAASEPGGYHAALEAYDADRFAAAEHTLTSLLARSPADMRARLLLGWAIWSQSRYDEALTVFKGVLHEAPARRAATWEEADRFELPRAERTVIDNPDLVQARQGLGWTYFKKGWPRSALAQFEALQGRYPDWDAPYLGLGYALIALGQRDRGRVALEEYARRTRATHLAERGFGDFWLAEGRPERAIPHLERALARKPGWTEVQSELAWAYAAVGRDADAGRLFTVLKASRPIEWETGMARLALNRGQLDEAEAALDRVAAKLPGYGPAVEVGRELHRRRYAALDAAWALYHGGKPKEAASAFTALLTRPGALSAAARVSVLDGLGWSRFALKDTEGAARAFRHALQTAPKDAEATAGLGWIALERKDWAGAEQAFTAAATAAPGLTTAKDGLGALRRARFGAYDEGWARYWAGKPAEALQIFARLHTDPGDLPAATVPFVTAGVGWCQLELGHLDDAQRIFTGLARMPGEVGAEGEAGLGWLALRRRQFDAARASLGAALARVPRQPAAERGLAELRHLEAPGLETAWTAYTGGKFGEATGAFRRIVDQATLAPGYRTEARRGLAWSLLRSGRAPQALAEFDALTAVSADADALYGRGLALSGAGRHADAAAVLGRAAALAPTSVEILVARGWAVLRGGDASGAEAIFLNAYALAPASAEVNRSIAWARVRQHRPVDALAPFRYAIAQAPGAVDDADFRALVTSKDYVQLERELGWAYVRWHGFERARAIFAEMVHRDPEDGDAQFGLGYALYRLGQYRSALTVLDRAVHARRRPVARTVWLVFPDAGAYPILTDPWSIRGWAALFSNDVTRAQAFFRESLERDPELVSSLAGLGRALERAGDPGGAREAYLRASEIYPTYPTVTAGLRSTAPAAAPR